MRRIAELLLHPVVYGLGCVVVFLLAGAIFPNSAAYVVIGLVIWGILVGVFAARTHEGSIRRIR
jgi:hypothetical protein